MANRELLEAAIDQVDRVNSFIQGEQIFPIQDPALESGYINAVREYFNFAETAITNPKVVDLIKKSRFVSISNYENPDKRMYFIAFNPSGASYGLATDPKPRLVYQVSQFMGRYESENEAVKSNWQKRMMEITSEDGHRDWVFDLGHMSFTAYRSLGALDLKNPLNLAVFAKGVKSTFSKLLKVAEKEAAEKFNGITEPEEVKSIIGALNEANGILGKVLK